MDCRKRPEETSITDNKLTGLWQRWTGSIVVGNMGNKSFYTEGSRWASLFITQGVSYIIKWTLY
jgi:hypothetical protein